MTTTPVALMTDARIARGVQAWNRIKTTATEQRDLWLHLGMALNLGRKLYPGKANDRAFGRWCKDQGFGDLDRRDRAAAMEWADVSHRVTHPIPAGLSHPRRLLEWLNDQEHEATLPPDLRGIETAKSETIELDQRSAERIAKTINRARSGDEGSDTAQRHVEALAKQHGTTPEKLAEAAATAAPHAFFQFTPAQMKSLNLLKSDLIDLTHDLIKVGLSREAVAALFVHFANEIRKGN